MKRKNEIGVSPSRSRGGACRRGGPLPFLLLFLTSLGGCLFFLVSCRKNWRTFSPRFAFFLRGCPMPWSNPRPARASRGLHEKALRQKPDQPRASPDSTGKLRSGFRLASPCPYSTLFVLQSPLEASAHFVRRFGGPYRPQHAL